MNDKLMGIIRSQSSQGQVTDFMTDGKMVWTKNQEQKERHFCDFIDQLFNFLKCIRSNKRFPVAVLDFHIFWKPEIDLSSVKCLQSTYICL